jgi:hypothetical protein
MYAAFFKGRSKGLAGLFDVLDHAWMAGPYSHNELVFSDGRSASADLSSGVRFTVPGSIDFQDQTQWDLVPLNPILFSESQAIAWYTKHQGCGYDVWGDVHFVEGLIQHEKHHFFCSESMMDSLLFKQGWRFDPNCAAATLSRFVVLQ